MPVDPTAAAHEPHPDPNILAPATPKSGSKPDYEPHPEKSLLLSPERQKILTSICNLYSGSASEEDMSIYAEKAVYDDPLSFCKRYFYKVFQRSATMEFENLREILD